MERITVRDLGKDYRIYSRPSDRLWEALTRRPRHRVFTALDGVNFSLLSGESLGVVGDNGAGKSTLLKLLAGTIAPSRGEVRVQGRVAALLELGAGFHPEFSGRQNILLNGTLMGLTREEIEELEKEIIEFAELEDFIDQPIRSYSSGMIVRLAFAIATSVDPDVLVIDEALAVGDLAFQRKCIERMHDFQRRGKTLIFCSHSMYHVQELCAKALWLDRGRPQMLGATGDVINAYEAHCRAKMGPSESESSSQAASQESASAGDGDTGRDCRIVSVAIESPEGEVVDTLAPFQDVVFRMDVEVLKDGVTPNFGFALMEPDETIVAAAMTHQDGESFGPFRAGQRVTVKLLIPELPIRQGTYRFTAAVAEDSGLLWYESKHIYPVVIRRERGLGTVAFRRSWSVEILDGEEKHHGRVSQ